MFQPVKILSADKIREADQYTILNEPIPSIDLMERASQAFALGVKSRVTRDREIIIFCGTGNNGGDGLAVARLLRLDQFIVRVYVIRSGGSESSDFSTNLARLTALMDVQDIQSPADLPAIPVGSVVIDAIFGSGLARPVTGFYAEVIKHINSSDCQVLSIDIASGLYCDQPRDRQGAIIEADFTVSFQLPKLAFLMAENQPFVGDWYTANIGLHSGFLDSVETEYYQIETKWVASRLKDRPRHAHKGTFGKALLIEGSRGRMGAAVLSGRACLRTGAGLLVLHIPQCGYEIVQTALPEGMVSLDSGEDRLESQPPDLETYNAVGIGPGIGTDPKTVGMVGNLCSQCKDRMVVDADAINILAAHPEILKDLPPNSILTPHPKEFERLVGPFADGFDLLEKQKRFAREHQCYLIVKGAYTAVATPEAKVYFNSTGNPGMATAGSGDVLTGIITSLVAQGYDSFDASVIAVHLHGLAGDLASEQKGQESLIASDIIEGLPSAFQQVRAGGPGH